MVFSPMPDPRREPAAAAARLILEQNDMLDLRRELCRSNVFWAENGEGRTRYLERWEENNRKRYTETKTHGSLHLILT